MTLFSTHLQWNPFQVMNNNAKQNVLKKVDLGLLKMLVVISSEKVNKKMYYEAIFESI